MKEREASKKIEECVIASAWAKPETKITDTPEIYKLENPQTPFSFLNGIYRTNLLPSTDAEAFVQEHFKSYKDRQISFRWYQYPHSAPERLGLLLEKLNPSSITQLGALYIGVNNFNAVHLPDVNVEELTADNIDDYCGASNEGWSQTGATAERVLNDTRTAVLSGKMNYRGFLARYKGEPASTGILRVVNGTGYLLGGSTSPRFRGNGVYKALVGHRIAALRSLGVTTCFVLARLDTSAPICLKLGFKLGCECQSYDFNFT